jgi:hypothetical protein
VASVEIVPEPHLLSEESARGYSTLVATVKRSAPLIILPAAQQLSFESAERFRELVCCGSWLILESGGAYLPCEKFRTQRRILADVFGLNVGEAIAVSTIEPSYLTYDCPGRTMVRTFGAITPIDCSPAERMAEYGGVSVAARRRIGRGGVVYLGSILGSGVLAQEREAHFVATALLSAES